MATEAAAGEAVWRKTRSSVVDREPDRTAKEDLEACQSGRDPDVAARAAWRDRAEAEKEMAEASARAWERASMKQARTTEDPA